MWEESIVLQFVLMAALSLLFYKLNVHFLYDSYLSVLLWIAVGVPILVIALALIAVSSKPPQSYTAIAALIGLSNGMVGLGLKVMGMRFSQGRH